MIIKLLGLFLITSTIHAGETMSNFKCFKDYPNVADPKIKEVILSNELPNWDLNYLYSSYKDPQIIKDLQEAYELSKTFKSNYSKKVEKGALNSAALLLSIEQYKDIWQKMIVPMGYLSNVYNVELANKSIKALNGKAELLSAKISKNLTFFENELAKTSDN